MLLSSVLNDDDDDDDDEAVISVVVVIVVVCIVVVPSDVDGIVFGYGNAIAGVTKHADAAEMTDQPIKLRLVSSSCPSSSSSS